MEKSVTRLFEDDSLLYRRIRTEEECRILQEDLSCLEAWEKDWQMSNVLQPNQVQGHQNLQKEESVNWLLYHPWSIAIATVKSGKYPGVILTHNLSWNAHVDQLSYKEG